MKQIIDFSRFLKIAGNCCLKLKEQYDNIMILAVKITEHMTKDTNQFRFFHVHLVYIWVLFGFVISSMFETGLELSPSLLPQVSLQETLEYIHSM